MTRNDVDALDRIRRSITVLGFAPTVRELAGEIGVTVSNAHATIVRLVDAGKLRRTTGRVRALELADQPDLRVVDSQALRDELARRGETLDRLGGETPRARGRAASCAADTCGAAVRRGHLFCRQHWFTLPGDLRDELLRAFGAGDLDRYQALVAEARDVAEGHPRWGSASRTATSTGSAAASSRSSICTRPSG